MLSREIDPADFRDALSAITSVMAAASVPWWIQDGTLLGAVRTGSPIPGDHDVDIGIPATAFRMSLVEDLCRAGFTLKKSHGTLADSFSVKLQFASVPVDIFLQYERGDLWYCSGFYRGMVLDYTSVPFGIGSIDTLGVRVPCPSPYEPYLESGYGKDWRSPASDWHFAFSPYNTALRGGVWTRLHYEFRRALWHVRRITRRVGRALRREMAT